MHLKPRELWSAGLGAIFGMVGSKFKTSTSIAGTNPDQKLNWKPPQPVHVAKPPKLPEMAATTTSR